MLALIYRAIIFYALYAVIKRLLAAFNIFWNIRKANKNRPQDFTQNTYSKKEDVVDVEYHEVKN